MRKQTRKLSLHRETLRHLQSGALRLARGAGETFEIITTCACTDGCGTDTCNCGTAGCGTAGCGTDTCTREIVTTCVC